MIIEFAFHPMCRDTAASRMDVTPSCCGEHILPGENTARPPQIVINGVVGCSGRQTKSEENLSPLAFGSHPSAFLLKEGDAGTIGGVSAVPQCTHPLFRNENTPFQ